MNVQARYGLVPDKEILEILQAASKAKQVLSHYTTASNLFAELCVVWDHVRQCGTALFLKGFCTYA